VIHHEDERPRRRRLLVAHVHPLDWCQLGPCRMAQRSRSCGGASASKLPTVPQRDRLQ
jgi:hypothetical protein